MNVGLLLLGLGLLGVVLGVSTVVTMPTPAPYRIIGVAAVILVAFVSLGLIFTGAVTSFGAALLLPFLGPPIAALAIRAYSQSRHERSQRPNRA